MFTTKLYAAGALEIQEFGAAGHPSACSQSYFTASMIAVSIAAVLSSGSPRGRKLAGLSKPRLQRKSIGLAMEKPRLDFFHFSPAFANSDRSVLELTYSCLYNPRPRQHMNLAPQR